MQVDILSYICFYLHLDRPEPPMLPVVECVQDTSVMLSWKPPLSDGGCFITGYVVEKNELPSNSWLRVASPRFVVLSFFLEIHFFVQRSFICTRDNGFPVNSKSLNNSHLHTSFHGSSIRCIVLRSFIYTRDGSIISSAVFDHHTSG